MKTLLRSAFSIVGAVVVLFAALALYIARSTAELMTEEAERTVRSVVRETVGRIDRLMTGVEAAAQNSAWIVGEHLDDPDYMYRITRELVARNDFIVGSAVAFEPNFFRERNRLYAPYSCAPGGGKVKSFPLQYDYPDFEWYRVVKASGRPRWCEPYFDKGGAEIMLCTFSVPIKDAKGVVYAVLTADVSLEKLSARVDSIRPYPQSYAVLTTGKGEYIVRPPQGRALERDDEIITIRDTTQNGWTVSIVCPVADILIGVRGLVFRVVVFAAFGLVLILLVAWFYSARLQRAAAQRERFVSELGTARMIQRDFLPKGFPDNVHAVLRPAREVGGDLYDFVRRGDRLYFIAGDVSGRGVPAALFSLVAGTVFRMSCEMGLGPGEIIGRINDALVRNNETSMFVTVFAAVLDLKTGELSYGCAGHNPPLVIPPEGRPRFLDVRRQPPAGVVAETRYGVQTARIERGSKIVVYTDGVTDATRADRGLFGVGRLVEFAAGCARKSVSETTVGLLKAVDAFADGAEQTDDVAILAVGL